MQDTALRSKMEYRPYTLTKSQLEGMRSEGHAFELVNSSRSVWIQKIEHGRAQGSYIVKGYVESENVKRKGTCFTVEAVISDNKHNSIPWSRCSCTSAHYGLNPCHHAVRMRDVILANRREMLKDTLRR